MSNFFQKVGGIFKGEALKIISTKKRDKMKRIMIAGTHSGCGKTTVTCALLQSFVNRNLHTSSFKCGCDYIDPLFHRRIIGVKGHNLDNFFCDKQTVNFIIENSGCDIGIIEGVMGFYDGIKEQFSSFSIAVQTKTPVIIVVDCKGMSMSIGAVMKGFLNFRRYNNIVGFIFNRLPESLSSQAKALCEEMNTVYFGFLPYEKTAMLESRHLGLSTDLDIERLKEKTDTLSRLAEKYLQIDKILQYAEKAEHTDCCFSFWEIFGGDVAKNKKRIAVSNDEAFCFLYGDNVDFLEKSGCEVVNFSPLHDEKLPENIDGLILTGGYPELYARTLSENISMRESIRTKICTDKIPTIAECGGFMYLHDFLQSDKGEYFPMVGIIRGKCFRTEKLQRFGYAQLYARKDSLLCQKGECLKIHEFHYWNSTDNGNDFQAVKVSNGKVYDCVHADENLYAGYPHLYFYGNQKSVRNFLKRCEEYHNGKNQTNPTV